MAAKEENAAANGMKVKPGHSSHDHNGAPMEGTHRSGNTSHAGTNGTRVADGIKH